MKRKNRKVHVEALYLGEEGQVKNGHLYVDTIGLDSKVFNPKTGFLGSQKYLAKTYVPVDGDRVFVETDNNVSDTVKSMDQFLNQNADSPLVDLLDDNVVKEAFQENPEYVTERLMLEAVARELTTGKFDHKTMPRGRWDGNKRSRISQGHTRFLQGMLRAMEKKYFKDAYEGDPDVYRVKKKEVVVPNDFFIALKSLHDGREVEFYEGSEPLGQKAGLRPTGQYGPLNG